MKRYPTDRIRRLLFVATVVLFTEVAWAEIYKWVDANGNVHFGDKPKDSTQAQIAEPVQLNEGYRPALRTEEEQAQYEQEQQSIKRRSDLRQEEEREEKEAFEKAREERREEKIARCESYQEDIAKLSSMGVVDGVRTLYYVKDEDGNSITSERQREIVEELKAKMAAEGCP